MELADPPGFPGKVLEAASKFYGPAKITLGYAEPYGNAAAARAEPSLPLSKPEGVP